MERRTKGINAKLIRWQKRISATNNGRPKPIRNFIAMVPGGDTTVVFLLLFGLVGSASLGMSSALDEKKLVTKNNDELIIKMTRDEAVTVLLDQGRLSDTYKIYSLKYLDAPFEFKRVDNFKIDF